MLKFYELKEKMQTLSAQLSWSHYCELLLLDSVEEKEIINKPYKSLNPFFKDIYKDSES